MHISLPSATRASSKTAKLTGVLLVLLLFLGAAIGQAGAPPKIPLETVVLLDDSNSMRKTDPLELRFSAFSLFIRLLRHDDAVGIVKFDDNASIVAPLQPIRADSNRTHLVKALSQFSTRGRYTNIYTGLKVALEEMQQRGRETPEKAVILISDGLMDVNPTAGASNEDMLRMLRDTLLPAYREARVRIVTLALSSAADLALLEEIAMATQGHFFYAPQAQALSQALYNIFEGLKQPDLIPVIGQRLTIDSMVQEATFFIITDTTKEDVVLVRPDGVRLDKRRKETAVKWYVGKDYVLVTIREPPVGEWHIAMAQPRPIKVAVITDMRLEVALDQEHYLADQDVRIAARLVADGASSPGSLPLEELIFIAEVTPPNASEGRKLSMLQQRDTTIPGALPTPGPPALGQWHHLIYMPSALGGEYRGRVIANAPTFSREKPFAFRVLPSTKTPLPDHPSNVGPSSIPTPEIPAQAPTVEPSGPLPDPSSAVSGDVPLQAQGSEEDQWTSWAPWTRVLRQWAIGHGILFALGVVALIGLRLQTGAWWTWPQMTRWRK
jgi:hypothetical protein